MLILGEKQLNRQEMANLFGFDLKKLEKHPSFEVSVHRKWRDRANGGVVKAGAGMQFRTNFVVEHPITKHKETLRYCKTKTTRTVGKELKDVYEPREVRFMGMKNEFRNDLDLAVFFLLHPETEESPIRAKLKASGAVVEKSKISFIDKQKRATDRIDSIGLVAKAMEHANRLSPEELTILSKGLGFKNVDRTEPETVRADVLEYALKNPAKYIEQVETSLTMIIGKIHNLADLKVFKLDKIGNVRRWTWGEGVNKNGTIVDIVNQTVDAKEGLVNYMLDNINDYLPSINNMTDSLNARSQAERTLKAQEPEPEAPKEDVQVIGDALPDYLRGDNEELPQPTNFAEAVEYLTKVQGKRPSNAVASQYLKSIQNVG